VALGDASVIITACRIFAVYRAVVVAVVVIIMIIIFLFFFVSVCERRRVA